MPAPRGDPLATCLAASVDRSVAIAAVSCDSHGRRVAWDTDAATPWRSPMTANQPTRSRGPAIVVGVIFLALVIAAAAGLWYLFFRPAGPAPVSLASLPPVAAASASADPTAETSADPAGPSTDPTASTGASSSASTSSSDGISGTWNVDTSVGSISDGTGTFVGYRVKEELATVGAQEAVGRTAAVTGSMTIDGTTITAVDITADLTQLQSDEQ